MERRRTLAIGLDCFEISFAERLMAKGELPVLAARRRTDASALLDPGADQRTGLAWEQFWSGLSPQAAHRESAVEFDPATYAVWQEGARFGPFFGEAAPNAVVFDPPYVDLRRAPGVRGVVAWGAHDPGLERAASAPAGLLREMERRVGPYPGERWLYGTPWASPEDTRQMGDDLVASVDARSRAARWLLTERFDDWDLGVVVVSEPHSAAEGLWHGIDPTHPLHGVPSAPIAGAALEEVYRATDRLIGELIAATDPSTVVVFSMGGMGPNRSDAASMVLLPELLLRWSLGEARLEVPTEWSRAPEHVPLDDAADVGWSRHFYRDVHPRRIHRRGRCSRASARCSRPRAGTIAARSRRAPHRAPAGRVPRPRAGNPRPGTPTAGRRSRASRLPSFYDGRIRVNLRGREAEGIVDLADYDRVCDEVEALLRECTDRAPVPMSSSRSIGPRPRPDGSRQLARRHRGGVGGEPARVLAPHQRNARSGAVPPHGRAHQPVRVRVDHRTRRRSRRS